MSPSLTSKIDPTILDRYEIGELLGRGGFSEVVKAINKETNEIVAIKIITNPKNDPQYIEEIEAIENEINILEVYDKKTIHALIHKSP